jgi:Cu+-exporting ATPase
VVERNGVESEVQIEQVCLADRVIVGAGAPIPVDGVVLTGESDVDESVITGGTRRVTKGPGDPVAAGTVNGSGTLAIEVTAIGRHRTLAQIERIVHSAQTSQPSFRSRADHVARGMVPVVLAIAFVAFTSWYLFGPYPSAVFGVLAFVTVLIAAGPSAITLAIPVATLIGTGRGAQLGVLIRGGRVIERMNRIDTVVFDKMGTITEGRPTVTHVRGAKRTDGTTVSPAEILRLAAAVESRSDHPLARAIIASAHERGVEVGSVDRFRGMSGRGVRGIVGRFLVEVISIRHAHERGLDLGPLEQTSEAHVLAGRTPVVVVVNDTVQGLIVVTDKMRPEAKAAISRLKDMGYEIFLLSGDSKAATALAGREIGIERVIANVDPSDRADEIKRLQDDGRRVTVVGNGINDAPALAQADVGIALGVGPRIAIEACDVTLIRSDLGDVVTAMELGRRTMRAMRTNLSVAYGYNALAIPVAAGILYPVVGLVLSPVLAGAAMALSSLSIVLTSLRLHRFNPSTATAS